MRYCIDLDNTLCQTPVDGDYSLAKPLFDRIARVNLLKSEGHHICIWTARGQRSGIDHRALTEQQLSDWGVAYDELDFCKRDFDILIDDKAFNVDELWRIADGSDKSNAAQIVTKGWGCEIVFVNNQEYCGKILRFEAGKRFSMHYHLAKRETWYVFNGCFRFHWIDTSIGKVHTQELRAGDVVTNERGEPHQIECIESGDIFEVSSHHEDSDSYRIWPGDRI